MTIRLPGPYFLIVRLLIIIVMTCLCVSGCATRQPSPPESSDAVANPADRKTAPARSKSVPGKPSPPKPPPSQGEHSITNANGVLTLVNPLQGRVASVNMSLRFVVLDFALKQLPSIDQRLGVYRQGLKVGELKVTGPERGGNIVADLVAGEARVGDEVRPD